MADGFSIRVTSKDDISSRLRKAAAAAKSPRLMDAIGNRLVSLTKRTSRFRDERQAPWKNRKDGKEAKLYDTGALWISIRVIKAEATRVRIGSDKKYASIHQLGGRSRPMPARPYFPFRANGELIPRGSQAVERVIRSVLKF